MTPARDRVSWSFRCSRCFLSVSSASSLIGVTRFALGDLGIHGIVLAEQVGEVVIGGFEPRWHRQARGNSRLSACGSKSERMKTYLKVIALAIASASGGVNRKPNRSSRRCRDIDVPQDTGGTHSARFQISASSNVDTHCGR